MRTSSRSSSILVSFLVALAILPGPTGLAGHTASAQEVHGQLERIDSVRVLRVWGTAEEMGYAQGYLVGEGFVAYMEETVEGFTAPECVAFEALRRMLLARVRMPEHLDIELAAFLDGLEAQRGELPMLEALGRRVDLDDLRLFNAADMLRAFGCSGFSVWDADEDPRDGAEIPGLLTARNFDYPMPGPRTLAAQLILVRDPDERLAVATVTWPGFLGAVTGINEDGVCAFLHDGTGGRAARVADGTVPLAAALTVVLEETVAGRAHDAAESALRGIAPYPFSYMVRIVSPVRNGMATPERVLRVDPQGFSENPVEGCVCITTNHYLDPALRPDPRANDWTRMRYARLAECAAGPVTPETAWAALDSVSVSGSARSYATQHALVVAPGARVLLVGFARPGASGIVSATRAEPVRIPFARIFGR